MEGFQITQASIIGSAHARVGRSNQDAVCVHEDEHAFIAVVCDGCSSGAGGVSHNEVGAQLGVKMVLRALRLYAQRYPVAVRTGVDWKFIRSEVEWTLQSVLWNVCMHRDEHRMSILDMFLFTTIVAVITRERATFAAIGDGVVYVNGQKLQLGPFENNTPPYIGYALLPSAMPSEKLQFVELASLPTAELQSFLIGTDGVDDLASAWDRLLPNGKPVGVIDQLWTEDRFFGTVKEGQFVENSDLLRRHLVLVNGGLEARYQGPLKDDTTLVVGRRFHG